MSQPPSPPSRSHKNNTHLVHLEQRKKAGARIYSPTAARNKGPIAKVLTQYLPPKACVLEIASGTGEHGVAFCAARPDIIWMPSDPDSESRSSIAEWSRDTGGQMYMPIDLDMCDQAWPDYALEAGVKLRRDINVIYNANMLHIAPIEAALGLARGANILLPEGGMLILYGPFLFGANSASSNLEFDGRLKAKNSLWGVRELDFVKDIFAESGLALRRTLAMPANNHCLIFSRG